MSRRNITIALEIHQRCCDTLMAAIRAAPAEHLSWKVAPEARSIAEICRHLIRVDGWFLQKMGVTPATGDPKADELAAIETALSTLQKQLRGIIAGLHDDTELQAEHQIEGESKVFTWEHIVKHGGQHYLYHAAQIIYLRRAQDRGWQAPLVDWETAVDTISHHTWKG